MRIGQMSGGRWGPSRLPAPTYTYAWEGDTRLELGENAWVGVIWMSGPAYGSNFCWPILIGQNALPGIARRTKGIFP